LPNAKANQSKTFQRLSNQLASQKKGLHNIQAVLLQFFHQLCAFVLGLSRNLNFLRLENCNI